MVLLMLCVHGYLMLAFTVSTACTLTRLTAVAAEESLIRVLFLEHLVDGGGEAQRLLTVGRREHGSVYQVPLWQYSTVCNEGVSPMPSPLVGLPLQPEGAHPKVYSTLHYSTRRLQSINQSTYLSYLPVREIPSVPPGLPLLDNFPILCYCDSAPCHGLLALYVLLGVVRLAEPWVLGERVCCWTQGLLGGRRQRRHGFDTEDASTYVDRRRASLIPCDRTVNTAPLPETCPVLTTDADFSRDRPLTTTTGP
jgi:hypothetical protein